MRDRLFHGVLRGVASVTAGVFAVIVCFILWESSSAIREIPVRDFLFGGGWHPTAGQYNMSPMIAGSLLAATGSLLLTAPLGLGWALFLHFYCDPDKTAPQRQLMGVLAGIPSVLFGLWGLTFLVPLVAEISPLQQGQSLLAGILILTAMTLPTMGLAADAALASVSVDLVNAGKALGLNRRAIAWRIVIPAARGNIFSGMVLQFGRAIGETMAVLMVCGNIVQLPSSFFDPVRTLTANIALEMGYADERHTSVLFVSGLFLLAVVSAVLLLSERMGVVDG